MEERESSKKRGRLHKERGTNMSFGTLGGAPQFIAEHTVAAGETLSEIALKYYGSAAKPKYMAIYEANKAVIGDNPNKIKVGMVLQIPEDA